MCLHDSNDQGCIGLLRASVWRLNGISSSGVFPFNLFVSSLWDYDVTCVLVSYCQDKAVTEILLFVCVGVCVCGGVICVFVF